jgi:iron complex outermembrane receptor protein
VVTIGREEILSSGAQSIQQILATTPAVTGFGNSGQGTGGGGFGSLDLAGTFAPTIHGLGASASNGTLVLIDGHRLPLSGANHTLADPSVIAPLAIQRVEVLSEGASSTYGSDAVAGVINFITRRHFNGVEASAGSSFADGYHAENVGAIWGRTFDQGSMMMSYNYAHRSALLAGDRSWTAADHRNVGGNNFSSFNCPSASVQPAGSSNVFAFPYTAAGIPNVATNAFCDVTGKFDMVPDNRRHNLLMKFEYDPTDWLSLTADVVYSSMANTTRANRGTFSATVNNTNPFFQGPAGVTSETVRWDANELFGGPLKVQSGADTLFFTGGAEAKLNGGWLAKMGLTLGKDDASIYNGGVVYSTGVTAALAGTTTATALDVWNPAATNKTSPAVLQGLVGPRFDTSTLGHQTMTDATLNFEGPLLSLPGGQVRGAFGGEYTNYGMHQTVISTLGTANNSLSFQRDVKSLYGELMLPLVGEGNALPLMRRLDVSLAGRYDNYSDFGSTTNPKFAATWEVVKGLSLRGSVANAFTAPALTSRGNDFGVTAESSYGGSVTAVSSLAVPNTFPGAIGLPGCTAATPTCTIGTSTVTGIQINGGNKDLQAQKGKSWSLGADLSSAFVKNFRASTTLWHIEYTGMITAPLGTFALGFPTNANPLTLFPGGATPAQIAAAVGTLPQTSAYASPVYYIYSYQQRNALNLKVTGIDFQLGYKMDTDIGTLNADVSGSRKLKMDQQVGTGGEWFSILNTAGFNTTFPSNQMAARFDLGLKRATTSAHFYTNYSGAYTNWNGSAPYPVVRNAAGSPTGGGQDIPAYITFDLNVGYDFDKTTSLHLDIKNITDKAPPYYNAAIGYDSYNASPIGRMLNLNINKKW